MKYLICWQEIPENTKFYVLDLQAQSDIDKVVLCHNHYIGDNHDNVIDAALEHLSSMLEQLTPVYGSAGPSISIFSVEKCEVIVTGFIL